MTEAAAAYTENLIAAQGADDTLLDSSLTPEQSTALILKARRVYG